MQGLGVVHPQTTAEHAEILFRTKATEDPPRNMHATRCTESHVWPHLLIFFITTAAVPAFPREQSVFGKNRVLFGTTSRQEKEPRATPPRPTYRRKHLPPALLSPCLQRRQGVPAHQCAGKHRQRGE